MHPAARFIWQILIAAAIRHLFRTGYLSVIHRYLCVSFLTAMAPACLLNTGAYKLRPGTY